LALAAATKLVVVAAADHAVRNGAASLLSFTARLSSHAAAEVAESRLAAGDAVGAEALARKALADTPISPTALRTLGLALQNQGRTEEAALAMALAGGLGWRDTPTQIWLIAAFHHQEDYGAALERADALARRGRRVEEMQALFMAAALDPRARRPFIVRLLEEPSWRWSFFTRAGDLPAEQQQGFRDFLADFAAAGGKLRPEEATPFVVRLFDDGHYAQSAAVWRRYGAGETRPLAGGDFDSATLRPEYVHLIHFDGRKTLAPRRLAPFEWTFPQPAGSDTRLARWPGDDEGKALRVASGGNQRFEVARQALALGRGDYRLTYEVAAEPGAREEGYSWRLECLPSRKEIVTTEVASETLQGGRTRRALSFALPGDCRGQMLRLILHSGVGGKLDLWFDNVAVARVSGAASAPESRQER